MEFRLDFRERGARNCFTSSMNEDARLLGLDGVGLGAKEEVYASFIEGILFLLSILAVEGESKLMLPMLLLLLPRFFSLSATSEIKDLDRVLFLVEHSGHMFTSLLPTLRVLFDSNGKILSHL
jgi:hypothetical protein